MRDQRQLGEAAQRAAERRLEAAFLVMDAESVEDDEEFPAAVIEAAAAQLCAPFDGCPTCIVREVLDAAWPALSMLAARPSDN